MLTLARSPALRNSFRTFTKTRAVSYIPTGCTISASELAYAYMLSRSFEATSHAMTTGALDGYTLLWERCRVESWAGDRN
jgi:hypothetical protein